MKLGIIGRKWGASYARTLDKLGVDYWIAGREWGDSADGVIVATPAETHYGIAKDLLLDGVPIILEKPVTLDPAQAWDLVRIGGIAFTGHTRLFSPAWRAFKASLPKPEFVECRAGGTLRDPWWDWGPHLVAMCIDARIDPRRAQISVRRAQEPLSFVVNGAHRFVDAETNPSPLEVLCREFVEAIEEGKPNNGGLVLGAQVVDFLKENE